MIVQQLGGNTHLNVISRINEVQLSDGLEKIYQQRPGGANITERQAIRRSWGKLLLYLERPPFIYDHNTVKENFRMDQQHQWAGSSLQEKTLQH